MFATALGLLVAVIAAGPFAIEVVDAETGRGVPLIELRTVHETRHVTDSNGLVAFDEPGLMGQRVYFHVSGHGYEYPKDGFGYRGAALDVKPDASARLKVKRINIAERLYRITGAGIYADTLRLGRAAPTADPVLNGQVLGSDSVENAVFHDQIYWFWGDTNRPAYPLGNFHVPGATSKRPSAGGLDPSVGINLSYFVNDQGFAKETCRMPGPGPTWIGGLVVLKEKDGRERMFAGYVKVRNLLEVYEHGLVEFDDEAKAWKHVATFPENAPIYPVGHPWIERDGDQEYIIFATPYAWTRVRATADDLAHLDRYQGYTCLETGTKVEDKKIDRAPDGRIRYGWKPGTAPLSFDDQAKLMKAGALKPGEGIIALRDVETGKTIRAHGGSIAWNPHRKKWIMIVLESFGTSMLGEIWYAEAERAVGPWVHARKIVTHDKYSFYNPKHHPFFDQQGGRIIYFEGTYTQTFSGNTAQPTPRYDYNQVLYKLDLDDPRLNLPVAVRQTPDTAGPADFYALDHATGAANIPIYKTPVGGLSPRPNSPNDRPAYFILPVAENTNTPPGTVALRELQAEDSGATRLALESDPTPPGFRRLDPPIGRAWENPVRVTMP